MKTAMIREWDDTMATVMFEEVGTDIRMVYMDDMEPTVHIVSADYFWHELDARVITPMVN